MTGTSTQSSGTSGALQPSSEATLDAPANDRGCENQDGAG